MRFLGACCYNVSGSEGASERATKRVEGEPRCENTSLLSVRLSTSHPGSSATCKRTARMRSSGCCLPMGRTTNIASRTPGRPLNEWRGKASSSFQTSLCHPAFANRCNCAHKQLYQNPRTAGARVFVCLRSKRRSKSAQLLGKVGNCTVSIPVPKWACIVAMRSQYHERTQKEEAKGARQ